MTVRGVSRHYLVRLKYQAHHFGCIVPPLVRVQVSNDFVRLLSSELVNHDLHILCELSRNSLTHVVFTK